jgi:DNA recombination protein RmuC
MGSFSIGGMAAGSSAAAIAAALVIALLAVAAAVARASRRRSLEAARQAERAVELERRVLDLARIQADTAGRVHAMGESVSTRQAELSRVVAERLDAITHRIGQSMETTTRRTTDSLRHLHERIAVIDRAQKHLDELTTQVTSLREVLGNKQARGAFGQGRMEAIIADGLPAGAFQFQFTLTNGTRPDCAVFLPGDERPLVIDAKFPLEAFTALHQARNEEARREAARRVRQDVLKHVGDIAARYLIPGETQDIALMFVPAESIYAELHDGFDDVIQKAFRSQVVLVSPSLLMLAITVMQQILKDARMREAAQAIRTEVGHLVRDVDRLRERVLKLQQHFGQATDDLAAVLTSADRITRRGGRIEALDFDEVQVGAEAPAAIPAPAARRMEAGE